MFQNFIYIKNSNIYKKNIKIMNIIVCFLYKIIYLCKTINYKFHISNLLYHEKTIKNHVLIILYC